MREIYQIWLLIGLVVMGAGLFSDWIKGRSYASIPLLATLAGILIGPRVFNLVDPLQWDHLQLVIEETARVTLGIALMGVALRIPPDFPSKFKASLAWVLLLVMPLMFVTSGLLTAALVAEVPLLIALVIGGAVTPTDPVVASAIVTGKLAEARIPGRIRRFISTEAGANDGLAYPLVLLPMLLYRHTPQVALSEWVLNVILWEVCGAAVAGLLIGFGAAQLLRMAENRGYIEKVYFLSYSVALSLVVLGTAKLIQTDGIFSVFVAGMVFSRRIGGRERFEEERVQEAVNHFFTLPVFTLFGMVLPWSQWAEAMPAGAGLCAAILLLRRLPFIWLLQKALKPIRNRKEAGFVGWFGPIGVAALYYISHAFGKLGNQEIWVLGTLIIFSSIVAHGITATPWTRRFSRGQPHPETDDTRDTSPR